MGRTIAFNSEAIEPSEEETLEYIRALLAVLAILAEQEIGDDNVKELVCEVIAALEGSISCGNPKSLC